MLLEGREGKGREGKGREGSSVLHFDGPQNQAYDKRWSLNGYLLHEQPLYFKYTSERRLSHGFVRSSLFCSVAESRESLFSAMEAANSRAADVTYAKAFPSLLCRESFHFPPLLRLHLSEVDTNRHRHMHNTNATQIHRRLGCLGF